ncbi:hypothetical protein KCU98_g105, partial [Aureobasidium melanogenum]
MRRVDLLLESEQLYLDDSNHTEDVSMFFTIFGLLLDTNETHNLELWSHEHHSLSLRLRTTLELAEQLLLLQKESEDEVRSNNFMLSGSASSKSLRIEMDSVEWKEDQKKVSYGVIGSANIHTLKSESTNSPTSLQHHKP